MFPKDWLELQFTFFLNKNDTIFSLPNRNLCKIFVNLCVLHVAAYLAGEYATQVVYSELVLNVSGRLLFIIRLN